MFFNASITYSLNTRRGGRESGYNPALIRQLRLA